MCMAWVAGTSIANGKGRPSLIHTTTVSGTQPFQRTARTQAPAHSSQISYMEVMTTTSFRPFAPWKRDKSIKGIDAKRNLQDEYVASYERKDAEDDLAKCHMHRLLKNMSEEVTSLSPNR